jgi:hypothetical protein
VADGCDGNLAVLNPALAGVQGFSAANGGGYTTTSEGVIVPRGGDRDARDDGQWGVSFRYFAPELDTEFGAYAMNYHSRNPIFSGGAASPQTFAAAQGAVGSLASASIQQACAATGACTSAAGLAAVQQQVLSSPGFQTASQGLAFATVAGASNYFIEYPEDIRLYGLSFATTLPTGTAWSGEFSYRPNAPVQLNTTDILYGGITPLSPSLSLIQAQPGQETPGYKRKEVSQLQTTFTHFFDQVMGASRLAVVGEVGWTHVGGLESTSELRYGRDPVFGPGPLPGGTCETLNASTIGTSGSNNGSRYCENDGFTTTDSWGYRIKAIWDYNDVFAGVNLKPSVAWSHDVDGYSPGPGGNFEEGRKAVSLGLGAEYQNTYTADLSYASFFDGKYSTQSDRDFVALSFGMNF